MREAVRQHITAKLIRMADAQIAQAEGLKYLVTRDRKTGKCVRVGAAMASAAGEETIEVWEKDLSTAAWTDLANRAIDKPKEQQFEVKVSGSLEMLEQRLLAGRKRLVPV